MKEFIRQLRQRHVFRAAISYLVASWIALQVCDLLFPLIGLSNTALRILLITLIILFPAWLFLAYRFEWTPEGLRKTAHLSPTEKKAQPAGKRTNFFIIIGLVVALLLMAADRVFNITGLEPEAASDPPDIQSITTTRSYKYSSSWSPDGSLMAYSEFRSSFDLMLTTPDVPSSERRLTNHPADEVIPRWSSDGSKIAYVADKGSGANVYWISPAGGPERLVTSTNMHALEHFFEFFTSLGENPWSPDAQKLLFSRLHSNTISIWEIDLATGEERRITEPEPGQKDLAASWSEDGSRIVFQRGANIWVKPVDAPEYEVLSDEYFNIQPLWANEPDNILFTSNRTGNFNIWQFSLSDRSLEQVTFFGTTITIWDPSLSSNGRLAFTHFTHDTDLTLLNLDSRQQKRLTYHIGENFHPTFSPDSKQIIYQSNRTGNFEIWLLDLESEQELQLTDNPAFDIKPDVSPNGERYTFISNRTGAYHLWVGDMERGKPFQITTEPITLPNFLIEYSLTVSWSPEGHSIAYLAMGEKDRAVWIIGENGSGQRIAIENVHSFDWYLNDDMIIYNRIDKGDTQSTGLWIYNVKTGKEKLLYAGHLTEVFSKKDGTGIGFAYSESHWAQGLYVLDLDPENRDENGFPTVLGTPKKLTEENVPWHAHFGSWSPDGNSVVFVRDIDEGNIVEITNRKF